VFREAEKRPAHWRAMGDGWWSEEFKFGGELLIPDPIVAGAWLEGWRKPII
jgi:hypothetical protein